MKKKMFEIELKFKVNQDQKSAMLKGASLVSREAFHDVYYDSADFRLSLNDIWLRTRSGAFLLKIPVQTGDYESLEIQKNRPKIEIEDEDRILAELGIKKTGSDIVNELSTAGINALYSYDNVREKYEIGSMILDFDETTWKGHEFRICEVEMIVDQESKIPAALATIKSFATNHGLEIEYVDSRLLEIIKIQSPEHYRKLRIVR